MVTLKENGLGLCRLFLSNFKGENYKNKLHRPNPLQELQGGNVLIIISGGE